MMEKAGEIAGILFFVDDGLPEGAVRVYPKIEVIEVQDSQGRWASFLRVLQAREKAG